MRPSLLSILVIFATFTGHSELVQGAEPDRRGVDKEATKRWMEYYKQVAQEYDIRLDDHPKERLKPSSEAIHSYVYSAHATQPHGAFFVWTRKGRPEAIGAIWSHLAGDTRRSVVHDLHSLSLGSMTAKWKSRVRWTPKSAGIQFLEIPGAKPPAKSAGLRLAQMRSIARGFTCYTTEGNKAPLRLLSQPLYRYEPSGSEVVDGAIFGIFEGWDPEVLLLIEARKTKGKTQWVAAPVRFSAALITLEYKGIDFWVDPYRGFSDRTKKFYAPRVEVLDARLESER